MHLIVIVVSAMYMMGVGAVVEGGGFGGWGDGEWV